MGNILILEVVIMRNLKRILLITLVCMLVLSQTAFALTAADFAGTWTGKGHMGFLTPKKGADMKVVCDGTNQVAVYVGDSKARGTYTVSGSNITLNLPSKMLGTNVIATFASSLNTSKTPHKLTMTGKVFGSTAKATLDRRSAKIKTISKNKVKLGKASTVSVKGSDIVDFVILYDASGAEIGRDLTKSAKGWFTFKPTFVAKKNTVTLAVGMFDVDGKVPADLSKLTKKTITVNCK